MNLLKRIRDVYVGMIRSSLEAAGFAGELAAMDAKREARQREHDEVKAALKAAKKARRGR